MEALCAVCHRACLPGQDLFQCIPVRIEPSGKRNLSPDYREDLAIHRACILGLGQPALEEPAAVQAPSAPEPKAEVPGPTVERADVLDFLA